MTPQYPWYTRLSDLVDEAYGLTPNEGALL